ncbi:MAG: long-chain fatty acid--CoA ligase [Sandaracinaceae bacterium]
MTVDGTMLALIERNAQEKPNAGALFDRKAANSWKAISWKQYWEQVRAVGKGLMALGHEVGDCVALVGNNRPEWVICQHGINAAAGVPAPLYTTLLPDQMAYIVDNAQASIAICDEADQLAKYVAIMDEGTAPLSTVITMDDHKSDDDRVLTLEALIEKGADVSDEDLDARINGCGPDDVGLLIYTSGTTGKPKGAMFTYAGMEHIGSSMEKVYSNAIEEGGRYISYLPLCHAAEQGLTNFTALRAGLEVYFCRDLKKIKDHLLEVRPTLFFAVPRVWEKFEAALRGRLAETTGLKAKLASWAMRVEREASLSDAAGGNGDSLFRTIARKLVIGGIKSKLGLEELRLAGCGAAPISRSTLEFFAGLGILVHEGFGMTETTAFASVQPYGRPKFGTIGQPLPGVEARIAEDGEILLRGPNMVKGYYRLEQKTAELYTDGWMHTGDLGAYEGGFLSITGRKKDIIITAGGKNVAPAEMEGLIQGIAGVGQAVVVGDRQPYLSALIVLDAEALPELEAASGVSGLSTVKGAANNDAIKAFLTDQIESACNQKVARYQTIKKFEILEDVFSVDGGELTPTLKVKRNVVNEKYADLIKGLYASTAVAARA